MIDEDGGCLVVLIGQLALELHYKTWLSQDRLIMKTTCPGLIALNTCLPVSLPFVRHGTLVMAPQRQPVHCSSVIFVSFFGILPLFANCFNWLNGRWPKQKCHHISSAWSSSAEVLISCTSSSSSDGVGEKVSGPIQSICCLLDRQCSCCIVIDTLLVLTVSLLQLTPSLTLLPSSSQLMYSLAINSAGSRSTSPQSWFISTQMWWWRWEASHAMNVASEAWYWMEPGAVWKIGMLVSGSWLTRFCLVRCCHNKVHPSSFASIFVPYLIGWLSLAVSAQCWGDNKSNFRPGT